MNVRVLTGSILASSARSQGVVVVAGTGRLAIADLDADADGDVAMAAFHIPGIPQ